MTSLQTAPISIAIAQFPHFSYSVLPGHPCSSEYVMRSVDFKIERKPVVVTQPAHMFHV